MPYSSEFPREPVQVTHLECGAIWDLYAVEWPPKIVICTQCMTPLRLVGHDNATHALTYRQL